MPRSPRRAAPGLLHHVTARAVAGARLFLDDLDRHAYLARLTGVTHRFGVEVLDFCLMGTHVHLFVRAEADVLSRAIQDAHGTYARAVNDRHDRAGHLFDGRYGAVPVAAQHHLHATLRYLAHNPVSAGLVPAPADWGWSGYRALAGLADPLPFHHVDATLRLLAPTPPAARRAFVDLTTEPRPTFARHPGV